ncbi:MAG: hypothetical protein J6V54_02930 [Bacteroidales bacterium]|nr:hypothetical protein [Bacteroidales bacterium]
MNRKFVFQLSYDTIDSWYKVVGVIIKGLLSSPQDEVVVLDGNINISNDLLKIIGVELTKKPNLVLLHFRKEELLQIVRISANKILNEDDFSGDLFNNNGILRLKI